MNRLNHLTYFLLFVLCITNISLCAQEYRIFTVSDQMVGLNVGYGNQRIGGLQIDSEHDYEVLMLQGQYNFQLLEKRTWSLDFLLLPQFSFSKYKLNFHGPKNYGHELGLSGGLQFRKYIVKNNLDAYLQLAFGPHFVSGVPDRQDAGFIFSDSIAIGILSGLLDNLFLNLKLGLRHMSNARIKPRNGGVDNVILSAGLLIKLR
ncbi:acyloxyacyl hydrolase [Muriicola sp. E247]|uniref:acyloxyacyl hydrolase n=1 Tax=Muriicola sp. E247 TaxID=3242730 RepID=UPI0035253F0D